VTLWDGDVAVKISRCSFGQERLWFLEQLAPQSVPNVALRCEIRGALDSEILARTIKDAIDHHASLRTVFKESDGVPLQVIRPPVDVTFEVEEGEIGGLEAQNVARILAARPFDLATGPLHRFALLHSGPDEHHLVIVLSHLVSDMTSGAILVDHIAATYGAALEGRRPDTTESAPYTEFAAWQRARSDAGAFARAEEHWRTSLTGALALELPTDAPRAARRSRQVDQLLFDVDAEVRGAVEAFAIRCRTTPFVIHLAALQATLGRCARSRDVVVAFQVSGRDHVGVETTIGLFANTVVSRARWTDATTFRELAADVRRSVARAAANGELPFDRVVQAANPVRDPTRSPVAQVSFQLHGETPCRPFGPSSATTTWVPPVASEFDIDIDVGPIAAGQRGSARYQGDLFHHDTADSLVRSYLGFLNAALLTPDVRVDDLALDTGVIATTAAIGRDDMAVTVLDAIANTARRAPAAVAVEDNGEQVTYEDLQHRATTLARRLHAAGVRYGDIVAVLLDRSADLVVSLLAVMTAGATYQALDPDDPVERLQSILADSGASHLIIDAEETTSIGKSGLVIVRPQDADATSADLPPHEFERLPPSLGAYVITTSGSTGRPKAVMVEHANLANLIASFAAREALRAGERLLAVTPVSFDIAALELFLPLAVGGTVVLAPRADARDPERLAALIERSGIDVMQATPSTWRMLVESGWPGRSSLRALAGGEALASDLADALLQRSAELWNLYGPTETTIWSTTTKVIRREASPVTAIGGAIDGTGLYVLDTALHPLPLAAAGELCIGGIGVARGYVGNPRATAERFVPDAYSPKPGARMYRTGDVVRQRPDGLIDFLGRSDDQLKVRGHRVEVAEIEEAIRSIEGIADVAVVGEGNGPTHNQLLAYVVAARDEPPTAAEVRARVARGLPAFMVPSRVSFVTALPTTPNGKLDRRSLRALVREMPEQRTGRSRPMTAVEVLLAEIWSEVLGVTEVNPEDDFFDLGGHSLLATKLSTRIRERFGAAVTVSSILEQPTVEALASIIEDAERVDDVRIQGSAVGTHSPLSFAQQRLWFLDQLSPGDASYNVPFARRLRGPIDLAALESAIVALVERHEGFRTIFDDDDGEPYQTVLDNVVVPIEHHDVADASEDQRSRRTTEIATSLTERAFDLRRGPLVRIAIVRLADDEHVLVFVLHHIIADAWSFGVLLEDLTALYVEASTGSERALPVTRTTYRDYATWQRSSGRAAIEPHLAYWRERLDDVSSLALPYDRERKPGAPAIGHRLALDIDPSVARGLDKLAKRHHVSLFVVILAAVTALLSRLADTDDVVVAAPTAARGHADLERIVGFFVNLLALRTDCSGDPTYADLLARVRRTVLDASIHEDAPIEQVLERARPDRPSDTTLPLQVVCQLLHVPEASSFGDLSSEPFDVALPGSRFDLELHFVASSEALRAYFLHREDVFDTATVERIHAYLGRTLSAIANDDRIRISALPILDDDELRQIDSMSTGHTPPEVETSIVDAFLRQVAQRPEAIALADDAVSLTYWETARRAQAIAAALRVLGVQTGDVVAVLGEPTVATVTAIVGIAWAGAAYLPLDPTYPAMRLQVMLDDGDAHVVLTHGEGARHEGALGGRLLVALETLEDHPHTAAPSVVPPSAAAYVLFTSGSTGRPKGVIATNAGVVRLTRQTSYVTFGPEQVFLLTSPLTFDAATFEIWGALLNGGTCAVPSVRAHDSESLRQDVSTFGVTSMFLTASVFNQIVNEDATAFHDLQEVVVGGEPVSASHVKRAREACPRLRVVNGYGPTETTTFAVSGDIGDAEVARGAAPIGKPIANTTALILDRFGSPAPIGCVGELYIGGAGVARGYAGRPALTAERFVPDPTGTVPGGRLYRTGDLSRRNADGIITYAGRVDDQVKIRGIRVEPVEVEATIAQHPAVRAVTVQATPARSGGSRLVAYVVADLDEVGSVDEYVSSWRDLFDSTYETSSRPDDFDISGWVDSATKEPIPYEHMSEWVDATTARIRAAGASRVLEIGAGTGLLLHRLARDSVRYVATDIAESAVQRLREGARRRGLDHVQVETRAAHEIDASLGRFDAVVLSSVVQYFPDWEYLNDVLRRAVDLVDEGAVFVSDVRSLPLLEAFHGWVLRADAALSAPARPLATRAAATASSETELCVAAGWFFDFGRQTDRVSHVEVMPRLGLHDNEMTKFRFDAILHVGEVDTVLPRSIPWEEIRGLESLRLALEHPPTLPLVVTSIPNSRTATDVRFLELARDLTDADVATVEAAAIASTESKRLVHPMDVWSLARPGQLDVRLSWARDTTDGSFDAAFLQANSRRHVVFDIDGYADRPLANNPARAVARRAFVADLIDWLRDRVPAHLVPSSVVPLDYLPLLSNGKVDRLSLTDADEAVQTTAPWMRATNDREELLSDVWRRVLGLANVGVNDNFFELGGDSILGIQVSAWARRVGLHLRPADVFRHPTVAEQARVALAASATVHPAARLPAPLTPIQTWFFEQQLANRSHFNQAVVLDLGGPVDVGRLRSALDALVDRHDALTYQFAERETGWTQDRGARAPELHVHRLGAHTRQSARAIADEANAALDIGRGPVFAAHLLERADRDARELLLVGHHLVVDLVSWWTIVEDLADAYLGADLLPATPFAAWAQALDDVEVRARLLADTDRWTEPGFLDDAGARFVEGAHRGQLWPSRKIEQTIASSIAVGDRRRLDSVVLAAFGAALCDQTGASELLVDIEDHGRIDDPTIVDIDLSRTVGWFTSIHPIVVPGRTKGDLLAVDAIRDVLLSVPHRGIAYGIGRYMLRDPRLRDDERRARVSYNHAGRAGSPGADTGPFRVTGEYAGRTVGDGRRSHELHIASRVDSDGLHVGVEFDPTVIAPLAVADVVSAGVALIEAHTPRAMQSSASGRDTRPDARLARLSDASLDRLAARYDVD